MGGGSDERAAGAAAGPEKLAPGAEFDLIRSFFPAAPRPRPDVLVGAGDDCAVVTGRGIALSTDMSVEGVHFRREWLRPEEIGYRAAAAALSDLAAVAARPIGVLVSLALPAADVGEPARRLMTGVAEAAAAADAVVLGGDVARTADALVVDVVVVGEATHPVLRSGAQPGDELWVTGELGAAALAVAQWSRGEAPAPAARARFARPAPRVREARWLAERGLLRAAIDLSDGLAGDAAHLARASGAGVVLVRDRVPVHPLVRGASGTPDAVLALALAGGEDYELCFAAPPARLEPHRAAFVQAFGVQLTRVGRFIDGEGVFVEGDGYPRQPLRLRGYQHFEGAE